MKKRTVVLLCVLMTLLNGVQITASEQTPWKQAYADTLYEILDYIKSDDKLNIKYALYDINNDGVPEMLVHYYGSSDIENSSHDVMIYTYEKDIAWQLFQTSGDIQGLFATKNNTGVTWSSYEASPDGYKLIYGCYDNNFTVKSALGFELLHQDEENILSQRNYFYENNEVTPKRFEALMNISGRLMEFDVTEENIVAYIYHYSSDMNEVQKPKWEINNPDIAIFRPDTITAGPISSGMIPDGLYHVFYNNVDTALWDTSKPIRLLMINGGFVPKPEIVLENNRALVPVRAVSEALGAVVNWDETMQAVEILDGSAKISLGINQANAVIDGNVVTLDVPARIIEGMTYVPIRFIAEALHADVQYISDFFTEICSQAQSPRPSLETVSVVVIERPSDGAKMITADEGLSVIKEASAAMYKQVVELLKNKNRGFDDKYDKDYDSQAIAYTGVDMGRYYVYTLTGFEELPIFYNKYTGELYSQKAALPFLCIQKGFINISWLY